MPKQILPHEMTLPQLWEYVYNMDSTVDLSEKEDFRIVTNAAYNLVLKRERDELFDTFWLPWFYRLYKNLKKSFDANNALIRLKDAFKTYPHEEIFNEITFKYGLGRIDYEAEWLSLEVDKYLKFLK